ncbi:MAG: TerC family protein [Ignavibacteria bacterium]|nr:TerC family protein [Ignavibacteria bacterium]
MIDTAYLWIGFNVFVLMMLALDLGVFHRKAHEVNIKEAVIWSVVWITLALIFNYGVYLYMGKVKALEFFTGYILEKSLSVDNIFVFILVFSFFKVPSKYQHKILFWGILGALVMRVILIFSGVALLTKFHWLIYVFGGFLIFTGIKMLIQKEQQISPDKNILVRLFKKIYPVTDDYHKDKFFVKIDGKKLATPMFVVLLVIEFTDLIFAVDSIPAILAITNDTFIVYTSNVFAILGLRALYFALAGVMKYFRFLKIGLSVILVFVGAKMCLVDFFKFPISISLGIIISILLISVIASLIKPAKRETETA